MSTQWALGGSLLWAPFRHLHLLRSSHPSFHWMAALVQSIQTQRGTQRGTLYVCVFTFVGSVSFPACNSGFCLSPSRSMQRSQTQGLQGWSWDCS